MTRNSSGSSSSSSSNRHGVADIDDDFVEPIVKSRSSKIVFLVTDGPHQGLKLKVSIPAKVGATVQFGIGRAKKFTSNAYSKHSHTGIHLKDDMDVSAKHAEIIIDHSGQVFLRDRGSSNGTFLNAKQIKTDGGSNLLAADDRIVLGQSALCVKENDDDDDDDEHGACKEDVSVCFVCRQKLLKMSTAVRTLRLQ